MSTKLRKLSLPEIPEGYRWIVGKDKDDDLFVRLEEKKIVTRWWSPDPKEKWTRIEGKYAICEYDYARHKTETVVESIERVAKSIVDKHIEQLELSLEKESVVGIYESGKNKAMLSL